MSRIKSRLAMLALLLAMALLFPAACYAAGYDWPQFHNTVDGAGYSASSAPGAGNILWTSDNVGAGPSSSPVIAGGKVYVYSSPGGDFGATSSAIVCLDEATGAIQWQTTIATAANGSWTSPAYDSGKVFIGSGKKAYCLDANSGAILWQYTLHYSVTNGSPRVADGKAFFTDWGGATSYCYALNENSGSKIWEHQLVGYSQATPAYDGGKVYVCSWKDSNGPGSGANNIYCLDASDGHQIWYQNGLKHDTCGSPCVAAGKVFVDTYNFYGDGEVAALDASDGHILWVAVGPKDAGTHPGLNEVVGTVDVQRTDSSPAYADGKLYLCGGCDGFSNFNTYCFNAETGALIWDEPGSLGLTVGNWTCSVAVAGNKVFVGKAKTGGYFDYDGLYALDAGDGHLVWSSDRGGSTPAVADGKVFSYSGGRVYAFGDTNIPVTGVTLDKTSDTITVGASDTLTATVAPDNATNKAVTWASDNPSVASVVYGTVTGHAAGSATITATTTDGNHTATCQVTVNSQAPPAGAPVITPSGGSYGIPQSITISISADLAVGRAVYYTTNGADPTVAGSVYYTGPFNLYLPQGTTTVRARVYSSGNGIWSDMTEAAFIVTPPVQNNCDLNGDGKVNVQDLVLVGQHIAETGTPGWIVEDINKDGIVNVQDLVLVGQNFTS